MALATVHQLRPIPVATLVARQSRTDDGSKSIDDQIAGMREWCERNDVEVGGVYIEPDVSGRKPLDKRKGLKQAVIDVEEGRASMLLFAYSDRYNRSLATRIEVVTRVEAKGGTVMTMDFGADSNLTAASKLQGNILAVIQEFQADQVGEKTTVSKQRNIDEGIPPFPRIPVGLRRTPPRGVLEPDPQTQDAIVHAFEMRAGDHSGNGQPASYSEVRAYLRSQGVKATLTIRGKTVESDVSTNQVRELLRSRMMIGELHFGEFTPNLSAWAPVVPPALWRRVQGTFATGGRKAKSERLLARQGILRCGSCGRSMVAHSTTERSTGKRYPYYLCPARKGDGCPHVAIVPAEAVEAHVMAKAEELFADYHGTASGEMELRAARVQADADRLALDNFVAVFDPATSGVESAKQRFAELQAAADASEATHAAVKRRVRSVVTFSLPADRDVMTVDDWRRLIGLVVDRAVVAPGRGKVADRVEVIEASE